MTSRRFASSDKNASTKDEQDGKISSDAEKSSVAPAVPASVIIKLLGFTVAMFAGPIIVYFSTLNTLFKGNPTWAGATAAFTANVVLIAYVIVAMRDDETEKIEANEKARKGQ